MISQKNLKQLKRKLIKFRNRKNGWGQGCIILLLLHPREMEVPQWVPPSSYRLDRRRGGWTDAWRSESGIWQQISDEISFPAQFLSSPLLPLPATKHLLLACTALDMPRQAGRQAHPRDKLLAAVFKTFWWGFGGERLGVDFVKESKWGASECCCCSILICMFGSVLSG